jgi:dTDP-4-amino-4,6-dideoxygalactose transaminase
VLNSGRYILGREVAAFEEEFAAYIGVRYAVGVANATDALEICLRACGIGPGDAVFTASHTAVATVAAIERCGATPALVDINSVSYTIDPNHLEDVVKASGRRYSSLVGRPSAVVPVHLYGHPADMQAILEISRRHGLFVVEDCAQAHGAALRGRNVGAWGHLAAFSFYPTKNLGALGDGGLVVTDDQRLAERVRALRQYGWRERYISEITGVNSRLDELQAAILRVKLRYLDAENFRRREIAGLYRKLLSGGSLVLPQTLPEATHVYHQYVVRTPDRDDLRAYLHEHAVDSLIHYPAPIHQQPAYQGRIPKIASLSRTEEAARQVLSLPIYPELFDNQVNTIARHILSWES